MDHLKMHSMNKIDENVSKIAQIFPNCVTESKADDGTITKKIDFDMLKQELSTTLVEGREERYQFTWPDKKQAILTANAPINKTLRPCREESVNFDNTENLYIEGDNLEVLKLLQETYLGKIKMIYIDPPYNTGNDFVYNDDFRTKNLEFREKSGNFDEEGNLLVDNYTRNTESNGRFHTDWLNMMYPRLKLARDLLSDDGVIFISIDDYEQENLKKITDEIFGSCNFIGQIVWERSYAPINMLKHFSKSHDYIIVYAKNIELAKCNGLPRPESTNAKYSNPDNDPRGLWRTDNLSVGPAIESKIYEIVTPSGRRCLPPKGRCWLYTKERYEEMVADNRIWFGEKGDNVPAPKRFLSEVKQGLTPMTIWKYTEVGHTQDSMRELRELFSGEKVFDYSKPVDLIKRCSQLYSDKSCFILDFFSGSATTAHAVMQLNAEDGGNRKFIMVQLPEETDEKSEAYKAGYKNICEIGKERIRRAGDKIKAEAGDKAADLDIGFKVFKLDSSNLQKWNPQPDDLVMTLQQATDNFLPDRTEQDVLYEIMLKMGLELTCQIEEEQAAGETVYIIGGGALMICLGRNITTAVAEAVVKLHKEYESDLWQVVFRDTGFASDMDKTNVKETLKVAGLDEDSFVCV